MNDKEIIQRLENEITCLKNEVNSLKLELVLQRDMMEKQFEKQKEYFVDGIKQIMLLLENEKSNNDALNIEVRNLRQKNHDLQLEVNYLKTMLKKYTTHEALV